MLFVPRLLLILSFAVGPCDPPGDAFGRLGGCGTVGVTMLKVHKANI